MFTVLAIASCGEDRASDERRPSQVGGTPGDALQTATSQRSPDRNAPQASHSIDPGVVSQVALDVYPETSQIDTTASVASDFTTAFSTIELGLPMVGYQFDISWDSEVVEFVSVNHLENGGLTLCPSTVQLAPQRILGACAHPRLISSSYLGPLSLINFRCTEAGEVTLHLRYQEGNFGTKVETVTADLQTSHSLILSDATITCA
jgi:hypothetical protein